MNDYYQESMRALQLSGMSGRTQECYTRSVRMLVDFYGKTPDKISEQELQNYFLHRKNNDKWSALTLTYTCGLRLQKALFLQVADFHDLSASHYSGS